MIAKRSDEPTGCACFFCHIDVIKPFGGRPDDYYICEGCSFKRPAPPEPINEQPDLSDSFWRIMLDERK